MNCRQCRETIPDGQAFCGCCGTSREHPGMGTFTKIAIWLGGSFLALVIFLAWAASDIPTASSTTTRTSVAYQEGEAASFSGVVLETGHSMAAGEPYVTIETGEKFTVKCYGGVNSLTFRKGQPATASGRIATWVGSAGGSLRNCNAR